MLVNVADDDVTYPYLHIIASILAWASAIINPFIYAFKNRQYQQAFVKVKCFQIDIMIGIDIYKICNRDIHYSFLLRLNLFDRYYALEKLEIILLQ